MSAKTRYEILALLPKRTQPTTKPDDKGNSEVGNDSARNESNSNDESINAKSVIKLVDDAATKECNINNKEEIDGNIIVLSYENENENNNEKEAIAEKMQFAVEEIDGSIICVHNAPYDDLTDLKESINICVEQEMINDEESKESQEANFDDIICEISMDSDVIKLLPVFDGVIDSCSDYNSVYDTTDCVALYNVIFTIEEQEMLDFIVEMQVNDEIHIIDGNTLEIEHKNHIENLNNNICTGIINEFKKREDILLTKLNRSNDEYERLLSAASDKIHIYEEIIDESSNIISEFKQRENKLVGQIKRRNNGLQLCKFELEETDKKIFNMKLKINGILNENEQLQINNKILNDKCIELNYKLLKYETEVNTVLNENCVLSQNNKDLNSLYSEIKNKYTKLLNDISLENNENDDKNYHVLDDNKNHDKNSVLEDNADNLAAGIGVNDASYVAAGNGDKDSGLDGNTNNVAVGIDANGASYEFDKAADILRDIDHLAEDILSGDIRPQKNDILSGGIRPRDIIEYPAEECGIIRPQEKSLQQEFAGKAAKRPADMLLSVNLSGQKEVVALPYVTVGISINSAPYDLNKLKNSAIHKIDMIDNNYNNINDEILLYDVLLWNGIIDDHDTELKIDDKPKLKYIKLNDLEKNEVNKIGDIILCQHSNNNKCNIYKIINVVQGIYLIHNMLYINTIIILNTYIKMLEYIIICVLTNISDGIIVANIELNRIENNLFENYDSNGLVKKCFEIELNYKLINKTATQCKSNDNIQQIKQLSNKLIAKEIECYQINVLKYGGETHLLIYGQSESYREFGADGRVIKGQKELITKSKYIEEIYPGNHSSVWGSYFDVKTMKWGYKCCHCLVFNAYCTGNDGIKAQLQYKNKIVTNKNKNNNDESNNIGVIVRPKELDDMDKLVNPFGYISTRALHKELNEYNKSLNINYVLKIFDLISEKIKDKITVSLINNNLNEYELQIYGKYDNISHLLALEARITLNPDNMYRKQIIHLNIVHKLTNKQCNIELFGSFIDSISKNKTNIECIGNLMKWVTNNNCAEHSLILYKQFNLLNNDITHLNDIKYGNTIISQNSLMCENNCNNLNIEFYAHFGNIFTALRIGLKTSSTPVGIKLIEDTIVSNASNVQQGNNINIASLDITYVGFLKYQVLSLNSSNNNVVINNNNMFKSPKPPPKVSCQNDEILSKNASCPQLLPNTQQLLPKTKKLSFMIKYDKTNPPQPNTPQLIQSSLVQTSQLNCPINHIKNVKNVKSNIRKIETRNNLQPFAMFANNPINNKNDKRIDEYKLIKHFAKPNCVRRSEPEFNNNLITRTIPLTNLQPKDMRNKLSDLEIDPTFDEILDKQNNDRKPPSNDAQSLTPNKLISIKTPTNIRDPPCLKNILKPVYTIVSDADSKQSIHGRSSIAIISANINVIKKIDNAIHFILQMLVNNRNIDALYLFTIKVLENIGDIAQCQNIITQNLCTEVLNTMIYVYGNICDITAVENNYNLIKENEKNTISTVNSIMKCYINNKMFLSKLKIDNISNVLAIKCCINTNNFEMGTQIIGNTQQNNNKCNISIQIQNCMKFYGHFIEIKLAQNTFSNINNKNAVSINCIMQALIANNCHCYKNISYIYAVNANSVIKVLLLALLGVIIAAIFIQSNGMKWIEITEYMHNYYGIEEQIYFCGLSKNTIEGNNGEIFDTKYVSCLKICGKEEAQCKTNYILQDNNCVLDGVVVKIAYNVSAYNVRKQIGHILSGKRGKYECGEVFEETEFKFSMAEPELLYHLTIDAIIIRIKLKSNNLLVASVQSNNNNNNKRSPSQKKTKQTIKFKLYNMLLKTNEINDMIKNENENQRVCIVGVCGRDEFFFDEDCEEPCIGLMCPIVNEWMYSLSIGLQTFIILLPIICVLYKTMKTLSIDMTKIMTFGLLIITLSNVASTQTANYCQCDNTSACENAAADYIELTRVINGWNKQVQTSMDIDMFNGISDQPITSIQIKYKLINISFDPQLCELYSNIGYTMDLILLTLNNTNEYEFKQYIDVLDERIYFQTKQIYFVYDFFLFCYVKYMHLNFFVFKIYAYIYFCVGGILCYYFVVIKFSFLFN